MRGTRQGSARLAAVSVGRMLTLTLALALGSGRAAATPFDNVTVVDPIEDEIRILDYYNSRLLHNRIRLPHLNTRPLQLIELQGIGEPPVEPGRVLEISLARIERRMGRDRSPLFAPNPRFDATPRLFESSLEKTRFEVSIGAEGVAENAWGTSHVISGSGVSGRVALGLDRLLASSHYIVGYFENARRFGDPIIPNNDLIITTDESFISYTEEQGAWGIQFGLQRLQWGPGQQGSLVLSQTSPPMATIAFRARHQALRADGIAINATLRQTAGEQLAAHRIEWQLSDGFRAGITEAARYKAPTWQPLYLIGFIPYVLVQRIESQSEPDSSAALRNNVIMSFDATWRVAEGSRVYGELLLDDVHSSNRRIPNKFGYQFGWEGAGLVRNQRITWGGEWTRISQFVYTSYFGRDYVLEGKPIGFPTGPDARQIRLRLGWDPSVDWTAFAISTHCDKGENDLDEPFVPGSPQVQSSHFAGVVETTRELELGLRYWPASGVYLSASGGYRWVENARHVLGDETTTPLGKVEVRLNR
jgi:hypothetical protein